MTRAGGYGAVLRHVEGELAAGRLVVGQSSCPGTAPGRGPGSQQTHGARGHSRPAGAGRGARERCRLRPEAGSTVIADPAGGIGTALRLHLATRRLPMKDLVETRVMIESASVRAAAETLRQEELDHAAALLRQIEDSPGLDADAFHQLDADFHVTLTRAAGNAVNTAIMAALRDAIHQTILDAVAALPDWSRTAMRLRREHHAILRAVRAGDSEQATELVTRHVRGFH